jgi:type IX secretion system PorP/SprF family membrane protein
MQIKSNMNKLLIITMTLLMWTHFAKAQFEPQFTQYMFNEMFINPAYAGSRDQISSTLVYRNQWVGIDGAPKTQTASINAPLLNRKIGVGLNVLNESIGVTKQFAIYGNYAYRIRVGESGALAMGIQGGFINHQENLADVVTNEENDSEFLLNTPKVVIPNAGFGIYYNTDRFYAGISVPRTLRNKVAGNGTSDVATDFSFSTWHYYITSGYVFPVSANVKLKPTIMLKAVEAAPLIGDISLNALFKDRIWLGAAFRSGDAFAAMLTFQATPNLRVGYSYDYTTTELNSYSNGTHEINIGYDFSLEKKRIVTPRYF